MHQVDRDHGADLKADDQERMSSNMPPSLGLTSAEALQRLRTYGLNELDRPEGKSVVRLAYEVLREPIFLLLFAAVGLYFALGDFIEALLLAGSAALTVMLSVFQGARSERALAALRQLAEPTARVIRDGLELTVPAAELVPGDVVLLGEGQRIPADARLISGDALLLDESSLTGESATVAKVPRGAAREGEASEVFAGTLNVRGQAIAEIIATGRSSRIGGIGATLATVEEVESPLQRSTRGLVASFGILALIAAGSLALLWGLLRDDWTTGALASLTVAIALIPEEFPMILTVFLALGAWRMAQRKVLAHRPAAIEALGGMDLLCVDKTGTLTENRMRLAALWRDGQLVDLPAALAEAFDPLLACAALASARGVDPMDRAILAVAPRELGHGDPVRSYPLRPDRLAVIQVWGGPDTGWRYAAKGAPEAVFKLCRLGEADRAALDPVIGAFALRGLRVLAAASAACPGSTPPEPDGLIFEFEGLLAFEDPIREDVPPALEAAREAGVEVAMITGDHPATGLAIARQAGLDIAAGLLTGAEIERMDDAALAQAVSQVRVYARVSPETKLRLVQAFKAAGRRLAMIGDGVNDAPALEAAHVGLAMGRRGTDVAREAADLVLLDDRFASVVSGVEEGRRVLGNLRAALTFVVAVHVPIAGLALAPIAFGLAPILFPLQVVLLELIIDPMCALVFEARSSGPGAMRRPPRPAREALFGPARLVVAMGQGALLFAFVAALHLWLLAQGQSDAAARTATLAALVTGNLALAALLAHVPGRVGRLQIAAPLGLAACLAVLLVVATKIDWLASAFGLAPLTGPLALYSTATGLVAVVVIAAFRRAVRRVRTGSGVQSAPSPRDSPRLSSS